ncbi:MAG: hypothetical protein ACR2PG_20325 [Hyphomicrobiaceae bacterium]
MTYSQSVVTLVAAAAVVVGIVVTSVHANTGKTDVAGISGEVITTVIDAGTTNQMISQSKSDGTSKIVVTVGEAVHPTVEQSVGI